MPVETDRSSTAEVAQSILLVDDDFVITEGLAAGLEREGRSLIICHDIESAELIVEQFQPSHVISDVHLTGPFGHEGLDFIRYAGRHAPGSRFIAMSGDGSDAMRLEASKRGAARFLSKPFEVRELEILLDEDFPPAGPVRREWCETIRVPLLDEVLVSDQLSPLFQPIVALGSARVIGYESLARFGTDSPLRNPEFLFQYASRKDQVEALELACIAKTFENAKLLPPATSIFINVHPGVLKGGANLPAALHDLSKRQGVSLDRVVVEITEQHSLTETDEVMVLIEEIRGLGVRFAFDDVGIAHSHLHLIGKVRPTFLKISQAFGAGFESDSTKSKIVNNIVSLARDFDCSVILEGIEEESTKLAAEKLGIEFGQGYLFGRPSAAGTIV